MRSGPLGSEPQNWASGRLFPGKGAEGPGGRWSPARGDIFLNSPPLGHRALGSPWDPGTPGKKGSEAWHRGVSSRPLPRAWTLRGFP